MTKDDYFGSFWSEKLRNGRRIIYFSDEDGNIQNVGPLQDHDLKSFLINEHKINDHIVQLKIKKKELTDDLMVFARECNGEAAKIHSMNSSNPALQLEMSTNHFALFEFFLKSL